MASMRYLIVLSLVVLAVQLACGITPALLVHPPAVDRGPVAVIDHEFDSEVTRAAINVWNAQVGCEVFVYVERNADVGVWLDDGTIEAINRAKDPDERRTIGHCNCRDQPCKIRILSSVNGWCARLQIAVHELGHSLGLGHAEVGAMRDHIYPCPHSLDGGFLVIRVDDASREAARRRYCR